MMIKFALYSALAAAAAALSAGAAHAQVTFQTNPTSNSCRAPYAITLRPAPAVIIGAGGAETVTKVVTAITAGPNPAPYLPANALQVRAGNLCAFHNCSPAAIDLECTDRFKKVAVKVKFSRVVKK